MNQANFKQDFHKIKFKCQRCSHCCQNSNIRLSPDDLLRLCQTLNLSTSQFHQKYSYFILDQENQNLLTCLLKTSPECPFLTEQGCTVYENRPFGCRTFHLAVQPFFDGQTFKNQYYILENCPGFNTNKKISLREFKEQQGITALEKNQAEWVKFNVRAINSQPPATKEQKLNFVSICYDFDNPHFKEILKKNNLDWPEDIEEKYKLILDLANKLLL